MTTALDPKQIVSFEELLMSQVVQQEALTKLLIEKGIFTKEEFLEMVKVGESGDGKEGRTKMNNKREVDDNLKSKKPTDMEVI